MNPKYNIGQQVYHATPCGYSWGKVLDLRYYPNRNRWEYLVSFSPEIETLWYHEEELSLEKAII